MVLGNDSPGKNKKYPVFLRISTIEFRNLSVDMTMELQKYNIYRITGTTQKLFNGYWLS